MRSHRSWHLHARTYDTCLVVETATRLLWRAGRESMRLLLAIAGGGAGDRWWCGNSSGKVYFFLRFSPPVILADSCCLLALREIFLTIIIMLISIPNCRYPSLMDDNPPIARGRACKRLRYEDEVVCQLWREKKIAAVLSCFRLGPIVWLWYPFRSLLSSVF